MTARNDLITEKITRHEANRYTFAELNRPRGESHYAAAFPHEDDFTEIRWYVEEAVHTINEVGRDLDQYVTEVEALLTEEQSDDLTLDPPTVEMMPADATLERLAAIENALRGRP